MYGSKVKDGLDSLISEVYSEKMTINPEDKTNVNPEKFWDSMELLALNNKVALNFKLR